MTIDNFVTASGKILLNVVVFHAHVFIQTKTYNHAISAVACKHLNKKYYSNPYIVHIQKD